MVKYSRPTRATRPQPPHHCPLPHPTLYAQVFGGLVTGMVVKYCDNILKNFALAVSVILTVLVAIPLFGQVRCDGCRADVSVGWASASR